MEYLNKAPKSMNHSTSIGKNGKTVITLREEYENDESKSLTVKECENGFIICINHNYREKRKGGDGYEYKWDEKEYISPTNPLENMKPIKEEKKKEMTTKDITNSINSFLSGMSGKLSV